MTRQDNINSKTLVKEGRNLLRRSVGSPATENEWQDWLTENGSALLTEAEAAQKMRKTLAQVEASETPS